MAPLATTGVQIIGGLLCQRQQRHQCLIIWYGRLRHSTRLGMRTEGAPLWRLLTDMDTLQDLCTTDTALLYMQAT